MTASLFGKRFVGHREPAWHNLGLVVQEEISAREAFQRMGPYEVKLVTVRGNVPVGPLPYKVIVRDPTPDDPQHRTFGIVKEGYTLITPANFCDIWDEHVAEPIETIGALGHGETLFISTQLPDFNVRGDEVKNFLLAVSPMTGGQVAEVRITPVRVVCQNTLIASGEMATEFYRIRHDAHAKERLASWLTDAMERALARAEILKEAFNVLADCQLVSSETEEVLAETYPMPRPPKEDAPPNVMEQRLKAYEDSKVGILHRRASAMELFEGRGTGMDLPATKGTAWGIYNSVVELEDYRRGRGDRAIAEDALFGGRAQAKARAFEACLRVSGN